MTDVANGVGDPYITKWAQRIAANGTPAPDGNYYIRIFWETPAATGSWGSSAPATWIQAYQHVANDFHGVSPRFKMVWDTEAGLILDNSIYYPGDQYVDVISQDLYFNTNAALGGGTVASSWNYALTASNGLNWMTAFSQAHNKPMAISEWGINADNAASIVRKMYNWFSTHNVAYQLYFDADWANYPDYLDDNAYPAAGAVYRQVTCATINGRPTRTPARAGTSPTLRVP